MPLKLGDLLVKTLRPLPYFRGRARLLGALLPGSGVRTAEVGGFPLRLSLSDYIQRKIYMGCYEPRETKLVQALLRPGDTFVDAGANIGYYTAMAAGLVGPAGTVLAFEPFPELYGALQRTFAACDRVKCLSAALSDRDGQLTLYVPPESYGNIDPSAFQYCADMREISVPARPLTEVLTDLGVETVHLLKTDTEGFELRVLKGCEQLLGEGRIHAVLCEVNPGLLDLAGSSPKELIEYLLDRGFRLSTPYRDGDFANLLFLHGRSGIRCNLIARLDHFGKSGRTIGAGDRVCRRLREGSVSVRCGYRVGQRANVHTDIFSRGPAVPVGAGLAQTIVASVRIRKPHQIQRTWEVVR